LSDASRLSTAEIESSLRLLRRQEAALEARNSLLSYLRFVHPDPNAIEDVTQSNYVETPLAKVLADGFEKVERGEVMRLAISTGPQLGKSQIVSRDGIAWFSGRNPAKNIMLGAYNSTFAEEFGGDVRNRIKGTLHRQVFPKHEFLNNASARDYMITSAGGKMAFIGVGGSGTGKPADLFVVDDPIRNDEDAQSQLYRDKVWNWFNKVVFTRAHAKTPIIVCLTRWHEDDLIGRLCDPEHPERNGRYAGIADNWTYLNIPSVVTDGEMAKSLGLELAFQSDPKVVEQFGEEPMVALWEERKGLKFLAEARQQDARAFDALYMGRPSPDDGAYFTKDMLTEYDRGELPKNLRVYAASDHAVTKKQRNDATCFGCVGIDDKDDIWVFDDIWWKRETTDKVVEAMLSQMKKHQPMTWWAASDHISKSIGPFLMKRMNEERVYMTHVDESPEVGDKEQKAQAIKGRMAMKKVHFPRYASWWRAAKAELLRFPNGTHDDFVDFMSHIGRGLKRQQKAGPIRPAVKTPTPGTFAWMKWSSERRAGNKAPFPALRGM
jgi:predicted phage terminase large subunit-like protein